MISSGPLQSAKFATAICQSTDNVGDLVYITMEKIGSDYSASKVDPTDVDKSPVVATITAKLAPTRAVIQFSGEIRGVYTGLTPGKIYWAGVDGQPVIVPPVPAPGGRIRIQRVGVAMDTDVLLFEPNIYTIIRVG